MLLGTVTGAADCWVARSPSGKPIGATYMTWQAAANALAQEVAS